MCGVIEYWSFVALSAVAGWLGGYMGAYVKKKGENRAIHEDLKQVVEQMKAVTQATKEIESKISNDVWDRQKQWELKREVLFEAAKRLSDVDSALLSLQTFWKARKSADVNEASWIRLQHQYLTAWQGSIKSFEEGEALVQVTCTQAATGKAFAELTDLLRETAAKITQDDVAFYDETKLSRGRKFTMVKVSIRRELGMPLEVMSQSSESLAAPSPDRQVPK
jgi:hypothetical protein